MPDAADQPVEVLGLDHIYVSVTDLARSAAFYDAFLVGTLGFLRAEAPIGGDPHVHYYNRVMAWSLRPARRVVPHDPYAPGLHHFCFRVGGVAQVDRVVRMLAARGIAASPPSYFAEYAPDYYATFLADPDGIRLEVTNFRADRRERAHDWEQWRADRGG